MQAIARFRTFALGASIAVTLLAVPAMAQFTRVTTFAGNSKNDKLFNEPYDIVVQASGELLVSDSKNNRILRVSTTGVVTVFAGSGKSGSKDGAAAVAEFKDPQGLAYDRTRNILYVADSGNSRIRKIAPDGTVTTLSASGLKKPAGLAVDADGHLYIADTGHDVIRKLTSAGVMTTIAGTSNDNEDEADDGENENKYKDGPALQATFNAPLGLALSTNGALYVVDSKNDAVRKLEGGQVSTVAGGKAGGFTDGPALAAKFKAPTGIAFDAAGNLLITDTKNQRIRKVTLGTSAAVSTIAGDGASGLVDGAPLSARFKDPSGIAFAATAVFIADSKNGVIRALLQELSQGPSVTGVMPAVVAAAGVEVRVMGSGFVSGQTTVRFGSTSATQVTFGNAGEVVATVPAMASARYDVVVTTPGGTATLANGFVLDAEAPAITASAAPAPNAAGWNNSNVRVTFACTDPLSGIATCTAPIDVAAEGAPQTVNGVAVDRAGNQKTVTVTVKLDKGLPVIAAVVTPAPNAAGWTNAGTTVRFDATDALSGIATVTPPVTVTTETAGQEIVGRAVDIAGNQAEKPVTVKLDLTAPAATATATPAPNTTGWNKDDVTVTFSGTDALSGIATTTPATVVSTETASQNVTGTVTDAAGNSASAEATVKLDKTAPVAAATATPAPNAAGWNKDNVTVTFSGTDSLSGVASTDPARTISTDGAQQVQGNVTDVAGNSAVASVSVNLDKSEPTITTALAPAPNAAGWNNSDVTITFTASDAVSGVASSTAPVVVSTEGNDITTSGTATDKAGNTATASATIKLDKTLPTLNLDPVIGSTTVYYPDITLAGNAGDALSGIETVTCDGIPAVVSAGTFQCSVTLPRGTHDVAVAVGDAAGNSATTTRTYTFADDTGSPVISAVVDQAVSNGWVRRPVTVAFRCFDGETGIASCSDPVPLTADGPAQTVTGTAVDKAGNTAQTTFTVGIDATAPAIAIDALPEVANLTSLTVTGSAADTVSGLTTLTCNGLAATVSGTRFTCQVPLITGLNDVIVGGLDAAGNETRATSIVLVDSVAPEIEISAPLTGATTGGATVTVTGTALDEDQLASVAVNGIPATISEESFSASIPLADGANAIQAVATDRAGNASTSSTTVTRVVVPAIGIEQPIDLAVTAGATIDVRGSVIGAANVTVNGFAASISGDSFLAAGIPLAQGRTVITAIATATNGRATSTSVNIYRDSIPPRVVVHWPADGATVTQSPITVTGMVDDIVVGTINAGQMTVTVNGVSAQVSNRSFIATGITLQPGENTLVVTAVDQGQNVATATPRVSYVTTGNRLTIVSGDAQTAAIGAVLPLPLVVRLTDAEGVPLAGQVVTFRIRENNGTLTAAGETGRTVTATTGADGSAESTWTLGMRAGAGNQRVTASAGGATTQLVASGTFGPGTLIVVDSGNTQISAVAAALPRPLVAVVVDAGSNRLPNIPVTFSVLRGGGSFDGQQSITVQTDSDGRAIARPTLGPDPGHDHNVFLATMPSIVAPATFVASGLVPGNPGDTRISGVVLDNSDLPVPGVSFRIDGTSLVTQSDAQGHFALTNVPVGYVKLFVDGSTATRPGAWPMLEYAMYTVPGADNTLGMPVYLLPLDTARGLAVSEIAGGTLTLPELPGFSLSIAPGAATFPGGSRTGTVSVTLVHADKMPMAPGFGQQPRFIVTIQPPGVHFDPPAAMTLPNVDGFAPGEVTEMYSFDHDLGQFVAIGTASASDDGSVIRSDPGVGIIKGGWHCGGNPASSGTSANCGTCAQCVGTTCQPNPLLAGRQCTSDGIPCTDDICIGGVCTHPPLNGKVSITALYVNRDDRMRTWSNFPETLTVGQPLYGNPTIGDHVRWVLKVTTTKTVAGYLWKATGPTTIAGPSGPNWQVDNITWKPGLYTVTGEVTFQGGCKITKTWKQWVGIRTNEYFAAGSIQPMTASTAGVHPRTISLFNCPLVIGTLVGSTLLTPQSGFNAPISSLSIGIPKKYVDRRYANARLFTVIADQVPTPSINPLFPDLDQDYGLSSDIDYRFFIRGQFKYLVDAGRLVMSPQAVGTNRVLTGETTSPCGTYLIVNPDAIDHPDNGRVFGGAGDSEFYYLVKVRAGERDQMGYANLNGRDLPYVFLKLRFSADDHELHTDFNAPSSWHSLPGYGGTDDGGDYTYFPTMFIFRRDGLTAYSLVRRIDQQMDPFIESSPVLPTYPYAYPLDEVP